jgi:hypothetical protein
LEGLGHLLESGDLRDPDFVVFGEGEAEAFGDVIREALVGAELAGHFEGEGRAGLGLLGGFGAVGGHFHRSFSS